jgi:anti-sigma regulatory factor (Ser/Thr protein kinase)
MPDAVERAGGADDVAAELRSYGSPLLAAPKEFPELPLPDEPQLEAWSLYEEAADRHGAFAALSDVFPQLRFPVAKGISETDAYRASTRRGEPAEGEEATGLALTRPDLVRLELAPTIAGRIPILIAEERADFEALVRAFSARNEPVDVPPSMGACLVRGLNDWARIRAYRADWESAHAFGDWNAEFRNLVAKKDLYEDRFIILSTGPYSGVSAARAGFGEDEWRRLSLSIRREHEAAHYFTLRAAGTMRTNLIDELIADYVGIVRTFGRYREDLALLFFGLEEHPRYREGARLQNYRGALSDAAFDAARGLAHAAVKNLAALDAARPARGEASIASRVLDLATATLEELADPAIVARLSAVPAPADRLVLDVASDPDDLDGIEEAAESVRTFLSSRAVPKKPASDVFVVIDEVLSNKAKYGWTEAGEHRVTIEVVTRPHAVTVEFVDDGEPFDPLMLEAPDTTSSLEDRAVGGLGMYIVKRLSSSQRYARTGGTNRFVVTKLFE